MLIERILYFVVRRPIATLLLTLLWVLLGGLASSRLPLGLLPQLDTPYLQVTVALPGYRADLVERQALAPLRQGLAQSAHLADLESWASQETGTLRLRYRWGTDMQAAYLRLNERIDALTGSLPPDAARPQVDRFALTDLPVLQLDLRVADRSLAQARRLAETVLKRRFEQCEGIARCEVMGGTQPQVRVTLRPAAMAALGLTLTQVRSALQSLDRRAGQVVLRQGPYRYTMTLEQDIQSVAQLEALPLGVGQGRLLPLGEVATVAFEAQPRTQAVVGPGGERLLLNLYQQPGANLLASVAAARTALDQLQAQYPGLTITVGDDASQLVRNALGGLGQSLLWGACLAIILMFLAFRRRLPPLLIALTVPTALLLTGLALYLAGRSLNVLSLAGLVVGVGILIDNSIIVVDNVLRRQQAGGSRTDAAVQGAGEVAAPLLGSALTTIVVFVPPALLSGLSGPLFAAQTWSLSLALLASVLVAITLIPTLYRLGTQRTPSSTVPPGAWATRGAAWYEATLLSIWRHPGWGLLIMGGSLALGGWAWQALPRQALPDTPPTALDLVLRWEPGLAVAENAARSQAICQGLQAWAGIDRALGLVGTWTRVPLDPPSPLETTVLRLTLAPEVDPVLLQQQVEAWLRAQYQPPSLAWAEAPTLYNQVLPVAQPDLVVQWLPLRGGLGLTEGERARITRALRAQSGVAQATWTYQAQATALRLSLRPSALSQYGLSHQAVLPFLRAALGQLVAGRLQEPDRSSVVVMGYPQEEEQGLMQQLAQVRLDTPSVPLSALVSITEEPVRIRWYAQAAGPSEPVAVTLTETADVAQLVSQWQALARELGVGLHVSGEYERAKALTQELLGLIGLALVLLYLIMAAQFESLWQPLIILLIASMGLAGALVALWLCGYSFNVMAGLGMLMVSGIVVNDSILKIDTINRYRRRGMALTRAVLLAGRHRLRPILLTMLTTLLAVLPLLASQGLGASLQAPLVVALTGGLLLDTAGSLFFLPGLYLWGARRQQRIQA
mgnify:CR=1 FL=1